MQLVSLGFLLLGLPLLLLAYYCIPAKGKQIYLLLSSFLMYGWGNWIKLFYLAGFVLYDYLAGMMLQKQKHRKLLCSGILACSVLLQVAVMLWFRNMMQIQKDFVFPVAAAVCLLQSLGYLIGIYRNQHSAEKNIIRLGLYLLLFPVLFAGPLFSYPEFVRQSEHQKLNIIALSNGFSLFIRGLAEKVVLADMFGYIFRELQQIAPEQMSMLTAWLITIVFSMYLYFELLGYSEMARGLGICFGYDLPKNFSHPFFMPSMTVFMQSWNITLVAWFEKYFRDFLFGKHQKKWLDCFSLILTGIFIGAWYGMHMQFLIWGFLIGILLVFDKLFVGAFTQKKYAFGICYTGILLQFLWVLFFTDNLRETVVYWKAMLGFCNGVTDSNGAYFFVSYIGLLLIGLYVATDLFQNITERFTSTKIGQGIASLTPVFQGILLLFCIASLLDGTQNGMLWLCC